MLLARRVYPEAPNHKLATLVRFANLPIAGRFHRAMADAQMAASLLWQLQQELVRRFRLRAVPHELLREIQRSPRGRLGECVDRHSLQAPE